MPARGPVATHATRARYPGDTHGVDLNVVGVIGLAVVAAEVDRLGARQRVQRVGDVRAVDGTPDVVGGLDQRVRARAGGPDDLAVVDARRGVAGGQQERGELLDVPQVRDVDDLHLAEREDVAGDGRRREPARVAADEQQLAPAVDVDVLVLPDEHRQEAAQDRPAGVRDVVGVHAGGGRHEHAVVDEVDRDRRLQIGDRSDHLHVGALISARGARRQHERDGGKGEDSGQAAYGDVNGPRPGNWRSHSQQSVGSRDQVSCSCALADSSTKPLARLVTTRGAGSSPGFAK